jgi:quercetin dioxygenase-like cupin family protein
MPDRFEDERGVIQDLFDGEPVAVTRITTAAGKVRGNHVHKLTTQWTLVIDGLLLVVEADRPGRFIADARARGAGRRRHVLPGEMVQHDPGVAHAWKALSDTDSLVFTRGPRSGEDYETDTYRLDEPLL